MHIQADDVEATERLGAQLAVCAQAGDIIFLQGELGAGKTSLARGFLRQYFADSTLEVPSPSYLICFTYDGTPASSPSVAGMSASSPPVADASAHGPTGRTIQSVGQSRLPGVSVLHLDPYRLPEGKVASLIDLAPAFKSSICLIEWPERLGPQLVTAEQPHRLEVTLGGIGPQACGRTICLAAVGARWAGRVAGWVAAGEVNVALPALLPLPTSRPTAFGGGSVCSDGMAWGGTTACGARSFSSSATAALPPGEPASWLVLGIESSCDDTGAAVVRGDGVVLGEVLASQSGVHEQWGGVVPALAQEAHRAAIDATVDEALRNAGISLSQLSAIAVTVGPGLSLCLEVGVRKAVALSAAHQIPLLRVHHMEAHAVVAWLPSPRDPLVPSGAPVAGSAVPALTAELLPAHTAGALRPASEPRAVAPGQCVSTCLSPHGVPPFPFLTLLVSGGHNMVVVSMGMGRHTVLGSTLDDSIGEAFDKTARLLGLKGAPRCRDVTTHAESTARLCLPGVPGGPVLEKLAAEGDARAHDLPRPLSKTKDASLRSSCDFSCGRPDADLTFEACVTAENFAQVRGTEVGSSPATRDQVAGGSTRGSVACRAAARAGSRGSVLSTRRCRSPRRSNCAGTAGDAYCFCPPTLFIDPETPPILSRSGPRRRTPTSHASSSREE